MASPHFRSPYRRLARAKGHIRYFTQVTQNFLALNPFEQFTRDQFIKSGPDADPAPATGVFLRLKAPLSDDLSDTAVDAMDALRSALDQACYGSAVALGAVEPKYSNFPFGDDINELENTIKGRCKDLHPEITDLLRTFAPHKKGDRLLWAFNKARAANQHKILCDISPVRGQFGISHLEADHPEDVALMFKPGSEDEEILIALFPKTANVRKIAVNNKFHIAFSDAGALTGEPAVSALNTFASKVEGIIMAIEAETARIIRERSA